MWLGQGAGYWEGGRTWRRKRRVGERMKEERVHLVPSMAARGAGKTTDGKEKRKQA